MAQTQGRARHESGRDEETLLMFRLAALLQILSFDILTWDGVVGLFLLLFSMGVLYGIARRQIRSGRKTHGLTLIPGVPG